MSPDLLPQSSLTDTLERLDALGHLPDRLNAMRSPSESYIAFLTSGEALTRSPRPLIHQDRKYLLSFLAARGLDKQTTSPWGHVGLGAGFFVTNASSMSVLETGATTNPLLDWEFGRWQKGGATFWLSPRLSGRMSSWSAIDVMPLLPFTWSQETNENQLQPSLYLAYLKLGHRWLEFTAGRFMIDWGHGYSGSFILGGQQPPLTGFRLRNTHPITLPWIFEHLGPVQFSMIAARLDKNQRFPHSLFVAQRINIRPQQWLELGFTQSIILAGDGSPDVTVWGGLQEIWGRRVGNPFSDPNLSNRNFMADYRLILPWAANTSLYGEVFFEDCCGSLFWRDISTLLGISVPLISDQQLLIASFEWVRTTEITFRNTTFSTGFADRGFLLGHPLGPDADAFYLNLHWKGLASYWIKGQVAYERRGRNQKDQLGQDIRIQFPAFDHTEHRLRWSVIPTLPVTNAIWLRGRIGYEYSHQANYQNNHQRHHGLMAIEMGMEL